MEPLLILQSTPYSRANMRSTRSRHCPLPLHRKYLLLQLARVQQSRALSAETAVAQPGGRLIVLRAPNFGWNLALNLKIDGRTAANIVQGRRYDDFVPTGRHMLTVSVVPNYQPTSMVLNVLRGQTYVFTATRQNTDRVVLVPSALPPGRPH